MNARALLSAWAPSAVVVYEGNAADARGLQLTPDHTQQLVRLLPAPGYNQARSTADCSPQPSTGSSSSNDEDPPRKLRKSTYTVRRVRHAT